MQKTSFIVLVFIHLKVALFTFREFFYQLFRYGRRHPHFLFTSFLYGLFYALKNPYKMVPEYGETPVSTFDKIAKECRLQSSDCFFDLGCGRGKGLFWLSSFVGCETVGIEMESGFTRRAEKIKRWTNESRVAFRQGDFFETSLTKATTIYLYGTLLKDEEIKRAISRFSSLKRKTKIITVSFPLSDYDSEGRFCLKKKFTARFPWGKTDLYLQEKT